MIITLFHNGSAVSGEIQLMLDNMTNELIINEDAGDVIVTISLSKILPQQFVINYRLIGGTASKKFMLCMHAMLFGVIFPTCML